MKLIEAVIVFICLLILVLVGKLIKDNFFEDTSPPQIQKIGNVNTPNLNAEIFEIKRTKYSCIFLIQNNSIVTFQCLR